MHEGKHGILDDEKDMDAIFAKKRDPDDPKPENDAKPENDHSHDNVTNR